MKNSVYLETCVVIPAYQAASTIQTLVREVVVQGLSVIVVNDASRDSTADEAKAGGAIVISRQTNGGKGTAIREGIAEALQRGYRWILTMDADGQHLASEISRFLQEAEKGETDLILGDRMGSPGGMPLDRRLINRLMSSILSLFIHQRVRDTQCGFRLISKRILEKIPLTSHRFEIESELIVRSARIGSRVSSIPVSCVYRRQLSFIRPFRDTYRFLFFLFSMLATLPREKKA